MAADLLTDDTWTSILRFVPQSDRLCGAALVCRKWARLAVRATDEIVWGVYDNSFDSSDDSNDWDENDEDDEHPRRLRDLMPYLRHNGHHLTSIYLEGRLPHQALAELPCLNLVELQIESETDWTAESYTSILVRLGPGRDGRPGMLRDCAASLTSLILRSCCIEDSSGLARLSVLVNLRHYRTIGVGV